MGNYEKRHKCPDNRVRGRWSAWRLFTAWLVALAVAAVILLVFRQSMASADGPPLNQYADSQEYAQAASLQPYNCTGGQWSTPGAVAAASATPNSSSGIKAEGTGEWADDCEYMNWYLYTMLTVGRFADDTGTYLGYSATGNARFGSLADDFHYSWNDYVVTAIYYQETSTGNRQLVFATDRSVPNDFYIVLGNEEFQISDSTPFEGDNKVRVWQLEDDLRLAEGQELRFKIG